MMQFQTVPDFNTIKNGLFYFLTNKKLISTTFSEHILLSIFIFYIFICTCYTNESPIDFQLPDCIQ